MGMVLRWASSRGASSPHPYGGSQAGAPQGEAAPAAAVVAVRPAVELLVVGLFVAAVVVAVCVVGPALRGFVVCSDFGFDFVVDFLV